MKEVEIKERRRYIGNLGFICSKLTKWEVCRSRMKELLDDAELREIGHFEYNFSIGKLKDKAYITLTDLPDGLRLNWLDFCWRAGIKFKEVKDFW